MTNPERECANCGQAFWGTDADGRPTVNCPACVVALTEPVDDGPPRFISLSALPPEKRMPRRTDGYRPGLFVPRRLDPVTGAAESRRIVPPTAAVPAPAPPPAPVAMTPPLAVAAGPPPLPPMEPPVVEVIPPPPVAVAPPVHVPAPVPPAPAANLAVPLPEFPRLGFNCPSCFSVLYIKDPDGYDGRAAPCPYCMASILPPRVVPQSPFMLVSNPQPVRQSLPPVPVLPTPPQAAEEVSEESGPPASRTSRWKPFRVHDFVPNETLSPETVPG